MAVSKQWNYDYDERCDCADDDNCGCSYPNNMAHGYTMTEVKKIRTPYEYNHARVGEQALNFKAPAVFADNSTTEEFNFFRYINDKYALLLFYRADFSAICPKEMTAFNQMYDEFAKRDIKIVAVGVDSLAAHQAWRKMPFAEGGVGNVRFPLVSDIQKNISLEYGVLRADGMAQRAAFLIDKNLTIRYQAVYDRKIQRNVAEILRIADELLLTDKGECVGIQCWSQAVKEEISTRFSSI